MDTTRRHILDLHRRGALRGALGLGALAALQPVAGRAQALAFRSYPFTLGVASGDPVADGMVLWTRLAPEPLAPMGGMPHAATEVRWEVAEDARFARVAQSGVELARPETGFSVHAEVAGLAPGRPYFYRFRCGAEVSQVGRTRTAPAADAAPAKLRFVNAGCQHLEHGYFTGWRHIANEADLDFVFHYGDFIYEGRGVQGMEPSWGPAVRSHVGDEIHTLENYRQRYAQYRLDPDLLAAQLAHPFLMVFDDHEVDNDWAGGISEENGGRAFPVAVPPELFALRKQAAFQAWWENMPLRRAVLPRGPEITAYRSLRFGNLARVHLLDTRSWRDDQPCGGNPVVVPACEAVARPDAQMLGPVQEKWLLDRVAEGGATWQVLAQQVTVMRRDLPGGTFNMDKWDGAPAARERLLRGLAERRASNPVILTGDIHNAWVGDLRLNPLDERSPIIASEFVATSITSGGDGSEAVPGQAEILRRNPHIRFANNRRGYSLHEATAQRMTVTHRVLPYVTRAGAAQEDRGVFVVEAGKAGVVQG